MVAHFILYVSDQGRATDFYSRVLGSRPALDVPGMTEFRLSDTAVLGLMPEKSAARLLGKAADFLQGNREPRAEVYLLVEDPGGYHSRALEAGAREISPLAERDWGHRAAYSEDPDGHVLAFAEGI